MKHMQIGAGLLLAALLTPALAGAQTAPGQPVPYAGQTQGRQHEGAYLRAVYALPLTTGQRQQIEQYVAAERQASQGASKETKHANHKQMKQNIDSVLSPQQVAQVKAEVKAERAAHKQAEQQNAASVPAPTVP